MKIAQRFVSSAFTPVIGKVRWQSPSNIALVKYWGKYGQQFPQNPSLSFTLSHCNSVTSIQFSPRQELENMFSFDFRFEGKAKPNFNPKIHAFFERILPYCPYIKDHHFVIESKNSFPHSSGIASSASGMSALALGIVSLENQLSPLSEDAFWEKTSFIARLGSGSAARSLRGPLMSWGETKSIVGSSQLFATQIKQNIDPVFFDFQDTILLIDKGQKKVSSTFGHQLMEHHPYASTRFTQAHQHMEKLLQILKSGDLDAFVELVELEALTLHALMMASQPYFILMQPNTLAVINKIWEFRAQSKHPLSFTLDAGANIHLLYPKVIKLQVKEFIEAELKFFCQNEQYIEDQVGSGAKKG